MNADFLLEQQMIQELMGADATPAASGGSSGALDASFLTNAAAEFISRGVTTEQNKKAAQASSSADAATLAKAQTADSNWASALVALDQATQGGQAQAISAAQALTSASQAQVLSVGTTLSDDGKKKRLAAVNDAATRAASDSLASPNDKVKVSKLKAWQQVAGTVGALAGGATPAAAANAPPDKHAGKGGKGNFFTRSYAGAPGYVWVGGGAVALTGVVLLVRHFTHKKGR